MEGNISNAIIASQDRETVEVETVPDSGELNIGITSVNFAAMWHRSFNGECHGRAEAQGLREPLP